jgi:hypothetical protein
MLLIATVLGVVGAALFRRRARTAVRLQNLKQRVFAAASTTKPWTHTEDR